MARQNVQAYLAVLENQCTLKSNVGINHQIQPRWLAPSKPRASFARRIHCNDPKMLWWIRTFSGMNGTSRGQGPGIAFACLLHSASTVSASSKHPVGKRSHHCDDMMSRWHSKDSEKPVRGVIWHVALDLRAWRRTTCNPYERRCRISGAVATPCLWPRCFLIWAFFACSHV